MEVRAAVGALSAGGERRQSSPCGGERAAWRRQGRSKRAPQRGMDDAHERHSRGVSIGHSRSEGGGVVLSAPPPPLQGPACVRRDATPPSCAAPRVSKQLPASSPRRFRRVSCLIVPGVPSRRVSARSTAHDVARPLPQGAPGVRREGDVREAVQDAHAQGARCGGARRYASSVVMRADSGESLRAHNTRPHDAPTPVRQAHRDGRLRQPVL